MANLLLPLWCLPAMFPLSLLPFSGEICRLLACLFSFVFSRVCCLSARKKKGTRWDRRPSSRFIHLPLFFFLPRLQLAARHERTAISSKKGGFFLSAISLLLRNIFEFTLELHSSRSDQGIRHFLLPGGGRGRESSEDCRLGTIGYPVSLFALSPSQG